MTERRLSEGDVVRLSALAEVTDRSEQAKRRTRRHTHHKVRSGWFQARAAWPHRDPSVARLVGERRRVASSLPELATPGDWVEVGPRNIGGRATSLVVHPDDADHLWLGAAGGGVWESTDAGRNWTPLWHDQDVLNVGALAMRPEDPDVLYCGTGEANLSADSYAGVGIYRSSDAGQSWELFAAAADGDVPGRIGVIAIDPFDADHIVVGGIGFSASRPGGMFVTDDGGQSWRRETFVSSGNHWCHAVVFDPDNQGVIYATFTENGFRSGIWRSRDGGGSWQHLSGGLPPAPLFHRTSLAVAPSDPDVLWAIASSHAHRVLGVFKSADGGDGWVEVGGNHFDDERQMTYNNAIVVHPDNPDRVVCGGVDLHRTIDGGETWYQVTRWYVDVGSPHYAHADHHALLIPASPSTRVYSANDGGLDISYDRGRSWRNRSPGLSTTMFYDLDVSQANPALFGGGAQDNGTVITVDDDPDGFFDITGGDGGWLVLDPTDAGHLFASIYNMNIFRFRAGEGWADVSPSAPDEERESMWMVFIAMDPNDPTRLCTGSQRVWLTTDDGDTWLPVSGSLDGSAITAIEIAGADADRIYVGTENGGLFRSTDGGDTWSPDIASSVLPGRTITRVATDPGDADVVYVTVANFGHRHVFRSPDGGVIWTDVDRGELPDAPHHSIAVDPDDPQRIFVCGDAGVFASTDGAQSWQSLSKNLPHSNMVDLVYHRQTGTLSVATYGRSIWRIQL